MLISESIFVIYILIALNFLMNKLKDYSCHVQRIYNKNMFVRHGLNLVSTFFLLVIFTRSNPIHPYIIVFASILLNIFFIVITRCHYLFLGIFIVLMIIVFYLESAKSYDISKQKEKKEQIEYQYSKYQFQIQLLSFIVIFIGLLVYIGQHAIEYKDTWSWYKFWVGVNSCKGNGVQETDILMNAMTGVHKIIGKD